MTTVEKIDSQTIKITEPKVESVKLDTKKKAREKLIAQRASAVSGHTRYLAQIDAEIAKLDFVISEADKLGVKVSPQIEVQPSIE